MGQTLNNDADILIVGGGLSGAMLAAQLMRLPGRRRVLVIEPRAELGRGEAYSAVELGHTLNGNAARMSVDPDNADDLTQWLTEYIEAGGWPESDQQHVPISELFPPRGVFGLYARQRLAEAQAVGALDGSTVEHVRAEVVDLQTDADAVRLTLSDGRCLQGAFAVLATGMFPAARTPQTQSSGLNAAALDPWDVAAMRQLDPQVDGHDHRLGPDHGRCRGVAGTGRASRADRSVFPPWAAAPCASPATGLGGFSRRRIRASARLASWCANCVGIAGTPSPKASTGRRRWIRCGRTSAACGIRRRTCSVGSSCGMCGRGGKAIITVRRP